MSYFVFTFYSILIFSYIITFLFIVYHFAKYSINSSLNLIILPIFTTVSALLLFFNLAIFFSIDWQEFFWSLPISF